MDDVRRVSAADTKLDQGRVRMGLGKGSEVLLRGVTASFLSNDEFGHDDGNRAIVDKYFGWLWRIFHPGEHKTCDSGFVVVGASDAPVPLRR